MVWGVQGRGVFKVKLKEKVLKNGICSRLISRFWKSMAPLPATPPQESLPLGLPVSVAIKVVQSLVTENDWQEEKMERGAVTEENDKREKRELKD